MPPRRFYVYYLTLSIGCIGAFCFWGHLPHRIAARRARLSSNLHSHHADSMKIARHTLSVSPSISFLPASCGVVLYPCDFNIADIHSPRARCLQNAARTFADREAAQSMSAEQNRLPGGADQIALLPR